MGHGIDEDVDAHGVRLGLGEVLEIPRSRSLLLPAVANVGVVASDTHHAAFVVEVGVVGRQRRRNLIPLGFFHLFLRSAFAYRRDLSEELCDVKEGPLSPAAKVANAGLGVGSLPIYLI